MINSNLSLADALFPDIHLSPEELIVKYPKRNASVVTRFAPSPTGFLHIGGVSSALLAERIAHQNNGIFFYRTEDTDMKRELEGAVEVMISGLKQFWITIDEGPLGLDENDIWAYGPYTQSLRKDIYQTFAKKLVSEWKAYPCFLLEEEIATIREQQTVAKEPTWIYWVFSPWRMADFRLIEQALVEKKSFVIRFRSNWTMNKKITLNDVIRGKLEMWENFSDAVILKKDWIPTYHFAHVVDDYLMGTTLVTRGDEWIPSYPLHAEMTIALGFPPLKYGHIAPIMTLDNGNKRKLSKRKDKESNIEYFFEQWYPIEALIDYMFSVMDSEYEAWRCENPTVNYHFYKLRLEKLPHSGALLDIKKLDFFSNEFLTRLATKELITQGKVWAGKYNQELFMLMEKYPELTFCALDIERHSENDPRRFTKFWDINTQLAYFYDETYVELRKNASISLESIDPITRSAFIEEYLNKYNPSMDRDIWFEQLKDIAHKYGFARNAEEWKSGWYKGRVGDIAMMLRILILGATRTPDLCLSMRALGVEKVHKRLLEY